MRELAGLVLALVLILGAGAAIFSAIRHRHSYIRMGPPKPPPRPPSRPRAPQQPTPIIGTGTVRGFDEGRPWDTPDIHVLVIRVDDDYLPAKDERIAFFAAADKNGRPTLEELRARVALMQAPPVCPDCGGIMHKEDDVDPEGIWFVSWRCDCLWTPSEGG